MRRTEAITPGRVPVEGAHDGDRGGMAGLAAGDVLLSPRQVAERVALSETTVRGAIARGELRAVKLCRRIRIAEADLDAWISSAVVQPVARPTVVAPPPRPRPRGTGVLRALLEDDRR